MNHAKFAQFPHNSSESREICYQNSCTFTKYFQIPNHRQRTLGNWSKSPRFCAFLLKFLQIRKICPHGQQSRSESSKPQENTANYVSSAPFAHNSRQITQKLRYLHTHTGKLCTFLHIFMYIVIAHILDVCTYILHNPRVVLHHYISTTLTVF